MMRINFRLISWLLVAALASAPLTACARKGKLKSPSQIEMQREKEARRKAEIEAGKAAGQPAPREDYEDPDAPSAPAPLLKPSPSGIVEATPGVDLNKNPQMAPPPPELTRY